MNAVLLSRVAAAILAGVILHVPEHAANPELFAVYAEDGSPILSNGRDVWITTHEHAADYARRMTGSSWNGAVYEARPRKPVAATVGPYAVAGELDGTRFACLDWTQAGTPVESHHVVPRLVEMTWGWDREDTYEADTSPFGAAVAFVRLVGEELAEAALDAAMEKA